MDKSALAEVITEDPSRKEKKKIKPCFPSLRWQELVKEVSGLIGVFIEPMAVLMPPRSSDMESCTYSFL